MITMEILGKIRRMYLRDKLSLHDTYGVRSFIIIFLKNIKNNINIKCDNKRPDPCLQILTPACRFKRLSSCEQADRR